MAQAVPLAECRAISAWRVTRWMLSWAWRCWAASPEDVLLSGSPPLSVSGSYGDVAGPFQFGTALFKSSVKTACRCGFLTPWATSL